MSGITVVDRVNYHEGKGMLPLKLVFSDGVTLRTGNPEVIPAMEEKLIKRNIELAQKRVNRESVY
ncbi:hypothetical protein [Clostridium sp. B9]|uniref:hypothetical protein n=1 Tax=Clostridium sp. B9 TaxID=3423224 RepID=UPI003D2EC91D